MIREPYAGRQLGQAVPLPEPGSDRQTQLGPGGI